MIEVSQNSLVGKVGMISNCIIFALFPTFAYANPPGDQRAEFRTQRQSQVVFLKTGNSQGILITSEGPNWENQSYRVIKDGNPRLEIKVPNSSEYGRYEERVYSVKLRSPTEAQRIYDKLDFTKGRLTSPAEHAEVALRTLQRARPYEVEGASTLVEKRALEERLAKNASAIRKQGWGTYSGARAEYSAGKSLAAKTFIRSTETLETRVGIRARAGGASAAQGLQSTVAGIEEAVAGRTVARSGNLAMGTEAGLAGKLVRGGAVFVVVDYLIAVRTGEEPLVSQVAKGIPIAKEVDGGLQEASRMVWKGYFCAIDILTGRPCNR